MRALTAALAALGIGGAALGQVVPTTDPAKIRKPTPQDSHAALVRGAPGNVNLVVIIHGYRDDIAPANPDTDNSRPYRLTVGGWVPRLAARVGARVPNGWDVWKYDWSTDANTWTWHREPFTGVPFRAPNFEASAAFGPGHGQNLFNKIVAAAGNNAAYEHVHFITHSMGGLVADTATLFLRKKYPNIKIHLTLLDAPSPERWNWVGLFGKDADSADHYFNTVRNGVPHTVRRFKHAYNLDIIAVSPFADEARNLLESHRWPREWYELGIAGNPGNPAPGPTPPPNSMAVPKSEYDKPGYGLSRQAALLRVPAGAWPPALKERGTSRALKADYTFGDSTEVSSLDRMVPGGIAEIRRSPTGIVNFDGVGGTLDLTATAPDAPAFIVLRADTSDAASPINTLRFECRFEGSPGPEPSGLAVSDVAFGDDPEELSWFRRQDLVAQWTQLIGEAEVAVSIPPSGSGERVLAIRLDTTGGPLTARLRGLRLGFHTVHPSCPADFNGDGQVDFFDYLDFVDAFNAGEPAADFNYDGLVDFFDYLDFIAAYFLGCDE